MRLLPSPGTSEVKPSQILTFFPPFRKISGLRRKTFPKNQTRRRYYFMFYQRSFQNAKIYKNLFRCTRQPLPGHSYFQTKCSSNIGLRKETSKLFHLIKEISAHPTYSNFKIHSKISTWHSKPKEVPLGSLLIMLKVTVQIIGPY